MNAVWLKAIHDLTRYTRALEEELNGSNSDEGNALVVVNRLLIEQPDEGTRVPDPQAIGDADWNIWHSALLNNFNVRFHIGDQLYDGTGISLARAIADAIPVPKS